MNIGSGDALWHWSDSVTLGVGILKLVAIGGEVKNGGKCTLGRNRKEWAGHFGAGAPSLPSRSSMVSLCGQG